MIVKLNYIRSTSIFFHIFRCAEELKKSLKGIYPTTHRVKMHQQRHRRERQRTTGNRDRYNNKEKLNKCGRL